MRHANNPTFEQQLIASPDDIATALVYADFLQAQGDPRGELMTLQHAGRAAEARALLERHVDHFFGELKHYRRAMHGSDEPVFVWHRGFIHSARIGYDSMLVDEVAPDNAITLSTEGALRALLQHPSGKLLSELTVPINMLEDGCYFEPVVEALVAHGAPALRRLRLGEFQHGGPRGPLTGYDYEISWTHFPDLAALWPKVPRLEWLTLQGCLGDYQGYLGDYRGSGRIGPISLPTLKKLEVISGGVHAESVRALTTASWPELEHFELWTGDPEYGFTGGVDDVLPLLEGETTPRLKHLALMNATFTDELIEPLARSPLLPQLTHLSLALGTLSDEGARRLARHRAQFKHLIQLDLSENFLTAAGRALVSDLCPSVCVEPQKEPRDDDSRYVSVGE